MPTAKPSTMAHRCPVSPTELIPDARRARRPSCRSVVAASPKPLLVWTARHRRLSDHRPGPAARDCSPVLGLGKSTLLGQIARNASSDVTVIGLIGERGREVRDFIDRELDEETRRRTVVVCATSDQPPLLRLKAALSATAIAEHFRDRGKKVLLLLVDSLTRVARAQREVGLAAGELPARQGYPPSVFALLPRLVERTGQGEFGSITAVYAVLVTGAGDDVDDIIAEEVRATLDGHIELSRSLAERGHYPAIDVLRSLSRVMEDIVEAPQRQAAARLRELLSLSERQRDLVLLGAYQRGSDPATDEALHKLPAIEEFLRQGRYERSELAETRRKLQALISS
jgi:FliI/YscN family ATPase